MLVLGVDPGLRNMGYCLMHDGMCVLVGLDDLYDGGEIVHAAIHGAMMRWLEGHSDLIAAADVVLVEKQFVDGKKLALSAALVVLMSVLQTVAHGKCRVVHACTIKGAYRTRRGSHPENKKAAETLLFKLQPDMAGCFSAGGHEGLVCVTNKGKGAAIEMHHVADAFLLCHWFFFKGNVHCTLALCYFLTVCVRRWARARSVERRGSRWRR